MMNWVPIAPLPPDATRAQIENYDRLVDERDREMWIEFCVTCGAFGVGLLILAVVSIWLVQRDFQQVVC